MKKALLILACCFGIGFTAQAQVLNFSVGDVCPDFTVTDVHGNTHSLYSITSQGKYVMLDFFFTTCPPCQQTVPYFSELHEKYGCNDGDLFCLAIDNGDNDAQVLTYENTYGGSFSHAPAASGTQGGGNAVVTTVGIAAYPTYTLIGPDNKFINTDIWPIASVSDFESAFPSGSNITPQACTSVSVEEAVEAPTMQIYPNPAQLATRVAIQFVETGNASLELYDLTGKKLISRNLGNVNASQEEVELALDDLQNGFYLVEVKQNGRVLATQKLNVVR